MSESHAHRARRHWLAWGFVAVAALWALILAAAPHCTALDAAGPRTVGRFVYLFASLICHQRPERSFHVGEIPLPVCARCSGIYLAAPVGAALMVATRRAHSTVWWRRVLLVGLLPSVITLAIEWLHLGDPGNVVRFLAGATIGLAIAALVTAAIQGKLE